MWRSFEILVQVVRAFGRVKVESLNFEVRYFMNFAVWV
jgi:hypothetical protein